jgi:hypothetical protein
VGSVQNRFWSTHLISIAHTGVGKEKKISYKVHTAVDTIGQVDGRVIMMVCCAGVSL